MDEAYRIALMKIVTLGTLPKPMVWTVWDKYFRVRPHPSRRYLETQRAYLFQKQAYNEIVDLYRVEESAFQTFSFFG